MRNLRQKISLVDLVLKLVHFIVGLAVLLFFAFIFSELFASQATTSRKLSKYLHDRDSYTTVGGHRVYLNYEVKARDLLGDDYDRICRVNGNNSVSRLNEIFGRNLSIVEVLHFYWSGGVGDEVNFGPQIVFEKNNRIQSVEEVLTTIKILNDANAKNTANREACFSYHNLYIVNDPREYAISFFTK